MQVEWGTGCCIFTQQKKANPFLFFKNISEFTEWKLHYLNTVVPIFCHPCTGIYFPIHEPGKYSQVMIPIIHTKIKSNAAFF